MQASASVGRFDGKVAIITGAGGGLGREHALLLASRGAQVVVNDLGGSVSGVGGDAGPAQKVADEINAAGGIAVADNNSVSTPEGGEAIVQTAIDQFGRIDIVINNAGILRDKMSFSMDEADFDAVVAVHLKGHFCLSRHAGVWWREQAKAGIEKPRRIINTTSEAGLFGSAGQANYAAAKSGVVGLTWVFARELSRYGVTANAIAPRARTPMTEHMSLFNPPEDGSFDKYDPVHASHVVTWLATDRTADINGQVFVVVGGDIYLVLPFEITNRVRSKDGWTVDTLDAVRGELLGDHKPEPPMTTVGA
jgi:NAD(P)-dependent dehydrogenase (short-subunit alcohol dehydrogenase family)